MDTEDRYNPPRIQALSFAALAFATYQWVWLPRLVDLNTNPDFGTPVPTVVAVLSCTIIGYALAMVIWLIRRTIGQSKETFRPTRGRLIGAICLMMVTPFVVVSGIPWVLGAIVAADVFSLNFKNLPGILAAILVAYPFSSMIIRHTYQRRWLRLGFFALMFWGMYAFQLLRHGVIHFTL